MTWLDLGAGILEEFVSASALRWTSSWGRDEPLDGSVEARRRAYRTRNIARGLCRSCPAPAVPGVKYCARHRDDRIASAQAYHRANRQRLVARMRARRAAARAHRSPA